MTGVPDTPDFNVADADGVSTVFTFTFFVYETDDIKVYSVLDDVETEITAGITKEINSSFIGGSVTFAAAPADALGKILIRRELPYTQETEFADITRLKETAIETALNVLALQIQQLRSRSELSPRYSEAAGVTDLTLGTPVDETVLTFEGTTGKIKSGVTTGSINAAAANAAAAATSAAAAASSATAAASSATAAASSASAASTSETNAGTSATAAAASATAAAASATAAAASETAAAASETAAGTSETNAAASEAAAAASAAAALTSETNAAASETAAATSESNASTSETNAAASAAAAAASAAEGLYNDVVTLTSADSPYVPSAAEEGKLFRLDMTSGAITINLSALSTYAEDMKFGFVKVDAGGNSATINRGGTDTISGATSITLSNQYETHVIVGDSATGTWIDTVQTTGIADGSVTNAKLADMAQATIKGRASGAGTGAPTDLTAAQVRAAADVYSTSEVDAAILAAGEIFQAQNRQASGTSGGSITVNTNTKVPLNTVVQNTITGASMTSSVITLPAGTYEILDAYSYGYQLGNFHVWLQNTTDGTVIQDAGGDDLIGSVPYSSASDFQSTVSFITGNPRFTIADTKNIEFQMRCTSTTATHGFGYGLQTTLKDNLFAQITLRKVG